jgi:glyoxylase-like metal-dependent hydrolase (beta-lactamase superfamily II)
MRLTSRIALIGSGDFGGFGLSDPLDCHVYLVDGGAELALIDAGSGLNLDALLAAVAESNGAPDAIRYLFVTHAHFDHSGGCRLLRDRLGLQVVASAGTAAILTSGDVERAGLAPAQRAGLYPPTFQLVPCPVDRVVHDGEHVAVGDQVLIAIATPGHSADHTAYLLEGEGALFSGDCVFAGGRISLQALPDCVLSDYAATIRRLATLDIRALLPSHGVPALRRGGRHLMAARDAFEHLQIPPQMVY